MYLGVRPVRLRRGHPGLVPLVEVDFLIGGDKIEHTDTPTISCDSPFKSSWTAEVTAIGHIPQELVFSTIL